MNQKEATDHTGQTFESEKAMCDTWGVSVGAFRRLRAKGMSLQSILEKGRDLRCTVVKDHLGNVYPSVKIMAEHFKMPVSTLQYRLLFMDLERALTTPVRELKKKKESKDEIR